MSRCIDADALIDKYGDWYTEEGTEEGYIGTIKGIVDSIPTIEPERKTGKWTHGREIAREMIGDCTTAIFYDGWTCSECGCLVEKEREPLYKYCPNCGADMRKDGD